MQSASDLKLPELAIEDPRLAADPWPYFQAARREHPWLARCSVGYAVTEYQAMKEILLRDDKVKMPTDEIVAIMARRARAGAGSPRR